MIDKYSWSISPPKIEIKLVGYPFNLHLTEAEAEDLLDALQQALKSLWKEQQL